MNKRIIFLIAVLISLSFCALVSFQVNAQSGHVVSLSPASWTMDLGQTETFTASASGGSGGYSYQWYVNSVFQSTIVSSFIFTPVASGSYSIYVIATDEIGTIPSPSNEVTVTVHSALVAPTISTLIGTVNQGQTSNLTSPIPVTGTSPYTYQWLEKAPGGSFVAVGTSSTSFSFVTSSSTAVGFEFQVTDSANLQLVVTSSVLSVTVNAGLSVAVSSTSWIMDVGQSKIFTAIASGGSGSYTQYQWYVGGVAQSGQNVSAFSYSAASIGTFSITVTVTDSLGSTSAQSTAATVVVSSSPTVSVAPVGPFTMDAGQIQMFTATSSEGSGSRSYQWYVDGAAVGSNSSSYSYTSSMGSHSVTCEVIDSAYIPVTSAASNAVAMAVTASPTVNVAPVGPLPINACLPQTFTATSSGGSGAIHYQWFLGNISVSGATSSTYSFSGAAGLYSVTCKVTDSASTRYVSCFKRRFCYGESYYS